MKLNNSSALERIKQVDYLKVSEEVENEIFEQHENKEEEQDHKNTGEQNQEINEK